MIASSAISPAASCSSALLARASLGCCTTRMMRSLPRLSRSASILAHHKVHANTRVPTQQPRSSDTPSILRGYPIHAPKGEPAFIDPLQYILKDVISPQTSATVASSSARTEHRDLKTQRIFDEIQASIQAATNNMVESLSHTSPAPSQRLFGTVVSDTCSTRGERTIEVEVTSAQLQNILMMQKRTASLKRPAALAAQSIAPRSTKGKANGDSCCVARTAAATATAHLRDCRRASTCATSSVAHSGEENHQSPEGALNTAVFLAIAAAAVLATSTTTALGLQHGSKDVVFLGQLQAAEISNVLNCSS